MGVLNIKDQETYALARQLADRTGMSLTGAVRRALEHELHRTETSEGKDARLARIYEILDGIDSLPVNDARTADEIIGYDENGLPT